MRLPAEAVPPPPRQAGVPARPSPVLLGSHGDGNALLGRPFCLDCYDHDHQVVWNHHAPQLWSRTVQQLQRIAKRHGVIARYAKVAEIQRRGVVHLHALFRLDGSVQGDDATRTAAPRRDRRGSRRLDQDRREVDRPDSPAHPNRAGGWPILWGDRGVDTRTVHRGLPGADLTEQHVAGYLAKYATKACEPAGLVAGRITNETLAGYTEKGDPHLCALIAAAWNLGAPRPRRSPPSGRAPPGRGSRLGDAGPTCALDPAAGLPPSRRSHPADRSRRPGCRPRLPTIATTPDGPYEGLRRWAHMLGFGGHFSTKSRRYSTTLGALRAARRPGAHRDSATAIDPADHHDQADTDETETTLVVGQWTFAGSGWLSNGDAALAAQAAAAARARRVHLDPHAS